jgi:hypothetical protein
MCESSVVQLDENALDRPVDPGVGPIGCRLRAKLENALECLVGRDAEAFRQDRFPERTRKVEAIEREDAAQLGLYPIDTRGLAVVGHRKDAHRIGAQHQSGIQLERRGKAVTHRR